MLRSMIQDTRYALRMLAKQRGFAAAALVTLALGIGGSTAIFTVVNAVVLEALPYPDADRLVVVWERSPEGRPNSVSPGTFGDWTRETALFDTIAARQQRAFILSGPEAPEQVPGAIVTVAFFDVYGVRPAQGRTFTDEDAAAGNAVIVTRRFARRHFGMGTAVGRTLRLDGEAHAIVGVLPDGSFDRGGPDIYRAWTVPGDDRRFHTLSVVAKLRDGVPVALAQSRLELLAGATAAVYPDTNRNWSVFVEPMRDRVISAPLRQTVLLLFTGAVIVLLIACANVASLTLARSTGRAREIAIRTALGAGRARIARQLLTESLVLGAAGGVLGVLGAFWAIAGVRRILPAGLLPREVELAIDVRALAFALGASLCAGLLCGLLPAIRAGRRDLADVVRGGGRGATSGMLERRFGDLLVAGEVAVTLVLVVSAGLLAATLLRLERVDPGFQAGGVLTWRVNLPPVPEGRDRDAHARAFYRTALDRVSSLPGVSSAAIVTDLPVEDGWSTGVRYRSAVAPPDSSGPAQTFAHDQRISAAYFETLRVPIRRGRGFVDRDHEGSERVVIVNETLARRAFGPADPIGRTLYLSTSREADEPWRVVGVAADVKIESLAEPEASRAEVFFHFLQRPPGGMAFVLRAPGEPMALARTVRDVFRELEPGLPLTRIAPLDALVGRSVAVERFRARLVGVFAVFAIVLAAVGIYGVRAYAVGRQYRELGIRLALGAARRDIVTHVIGRGAVLSIVGLAVGGIAALSVGRAMSALLFGIDAADPGILAGGVLAVVGILVAASYLPAHRAARIDPAIVLHAD